MENLRILTLALELENFTAGELAAHANASLSTVRSLIQRKPELFVALNQDDGSEAPPQVGRPAKRYRLSDPAEVRSDLGEIQREIQLPVVEDDPRSPEGDQALTLSIAESSLRRAIQAADPKDREVLAGMAVRNAGRALSSLETLPDESLRVRALAVRTFAELLRSIESPSELLTSAVSVLVSAVGAVSDDNVHRLLAVLLDAAGRSAHAPPIGVITPPGQSPEEVVSGLGGSEWTDSSIEGQRDLLWAPRWASELAKRQLLAAVVMGGTKKAGGADATIALATINQVAGWSLPLFVTSSTPPRTRLLAVERGALFVPSEIDEAMGVIRNTLAFHWHRYHMLPPGDDRDTQLVEATGRGFAASR
jgi:hypothetical protein